MRILRAVLIGVVALASVAAKAADSPAEMSLRLELFVEDIAESVAFYSSILGFEQLEGSATYTPVKNGSVLLGLGLARRLPNYHYFNPQVQNERRGLGAEIVLEVVDIENTFRKVKASGYPILSPLTKRSWGQTDFRLADPDGYYLRVTSKD